MNTMREAERNNASVVTVPRSDNGAYASIDAGRKWIAMIVKKLQTTTRNADAASPPNISRRRFRLK